MSLYLVCILVRLNAPSLLRRTLRHGDGWEREAAAGAAGAAAVAAAAAGTPGGDSGPGLAAENKIFSKTEWLIYSNSFPY